MMKLVFWIGCFTFVTSVVSCSDPSDAEGEAGHNSLVKLSQVEEGTNQCEFGGMQVDTGLDLNRNGILDDWEIEQTQVLCAAGNTGEPGQDGTDGSSTLFISSEEAPGENCEFGGIALHWGPDRNCDGVLTITEVTHTDYLCNGNPGKMSLVEVRPEDLGTNCPLGGLAIVSGVDTNGNGRIDAGEVASTAYLCNSAPGQNSLVALTEEPEGEHCQLGGVRIQSGLDTNGNGVLDDPEIQFTQYVCDR